MVSLRFVFNKEKVAAAGLTEDELLQPMRDHAKKYDIAEPEEGFFTKSGEDAMCQIGMFIINMTKKDHKYVTYFDSWIFDVDGEEGDCIEDTYKWYRKHGITTGLSAEAV